ncbi:hypothetical protein QLQ85_12695 [Halomonas sp. M4R5S39]|uniref:hypothetical protein n=1 Tax=Halomonas kalidii TaxID=3043293 RepID=UPI0024A8C094|nr:hypothetical protein [Halomonas kalidii]MDI5985647.1 hypothetical protein [Halomonas kalidii]
MSAGGCLQLWTAASHAHSQYFEMAATVGVLWLLGYLVAPAVYHWRLYRRDRGNPWAQVALVFTRGLRHLRPHRGGDPP